MVEDNAIEQGEVLKQPQFQNLESRVWVETNVGSNNSEPSVGLAQGVS